jgi:hypothetical protein
MGFPTLKELVLLLYLLSSTSITYDIILSIYLREGQEPPSRGILHFVVSAATARSLDGPIHKAFRYPRMPQIPTRATVTSVLSAHSVGGLGMMAQLSESAEPFVLYARPSQLPPPALCPRRFPSRSPRSLSSSQQEFLPCPFRPSRSR